MRATANEGERRVARETERERDACVCMIYMDKTCPYIPVPSRDAASPRRPFFGLIVKYDTSDCLDGMCTAFAFGADF